MIQRILGYFLNRIESLGLPRSTMWRKVRDEHLRNNPACAVCGRKKNLVPQHVVPVHVDPSLELSPENLITLCEGPSFNCHLFFGHFRDWTKSNPDVRRDAEHWRGRLGQ